MTRRRLRPAVRLDAITGTTDLDRLDIAASYRTHGYDTLTRAELLAARSADVPTPPAPRILSGPARPVGRYTRRNATADIHQHRPRPITYPAGIIYVCRCGWRDARAFPDATDGVSLTA